MMHEMEFVTVRMPKDRLILPCVGKVINPGKMPRVEALITSTTYKPGYELTLVHPVQNQLRDHDGTMLQLFGDVAREMFSYLHLRCYIPDSTKPPHELTLIQFQMAVLPSIEDLSETFLYHWRRQFFTIFEEHEVDEWLRHNGELVKDPHAKEEQGEDA